MSMKTKTKTKMAKSGQSKSRSLYIFHVAAVLLLFLPTRVYDYNNHTSLSPSSRGYLKPGAVRLGRGSVGLGGGVLLLRGGGRGVG